MLPRRDLNYPRILLQEGRLPGASTLPHTDLGGLTVRGGIFLVLQGLDFRRV
jgi:hypothetical protein